MFRKILLFDDSVDIKRSDAIKEHKVRIIPVDNFDCKEFNRNDAGWPRNDISQLARAQSQSEYDSILRRLVELKNNQTLPADMKVKDAISLIKPRYVQSPNEIDQFISNLDSDTIASLELAYGKKQKDIGKDVKDVEPSSSSSPAPLTDSSVSE